MNFIFFVIFAVLIYALLKSFSDQRKAENSSKKK